MPLRALVTHRFLLTNLVKKEFKIQYRNMSLGVFWSVLNPLIFLGTLLLVFTYINKNDRVENFGVFLLLGMIPYNFFSLCMSMSTSCLIQNAQILAKLKFPRIIVPIASVLSQIIHLGIQLLLLLVFLLLFDVPFTLMYVWIPLILSVVLAFTIGLSLITSIMEVYYRDTEYIVQSAVRILFWFTPIFYPSSRAHDNLPRPLYLVFMSNPLSGCIEALRRVVLYNTTPEWDLFFMATAVSLITLLIGLHLFRKLEPNLADHL